MHASIKCLLVYLESVSTELLSTLDRLVLAWAAACWGGNRVKFCSINLGKDAGGPTLSQFFKNGIRE